ncbi:D-alanyl-lipoteichoic acid biosynthesis protein DltD [Clostridium sp. SM-530-WT-3G]|uniref:D-alanyl-lipoteichoic acid biosynthesis protein DltD n=1 Tax=Clostridium sp. SM-530-WT-3G TaxID=2725303 RepID=UPI00145C7848|nr:D-alanyl-lipoteichoic acid biosynthesis protein DltD [Clostridium sp. SM-530-WT-3G]
MLRKILCIICPIAFLIMTPVFLDKYLDEKIDNLLVQKDTSAINREYGSIYKGRGKKFNDYAVENGDVMLQGSSELGSPVSQVPANFFPIDGMDPLITSGRAYAQHINQLSVLGSEDNTDKERKVALMLSLQWFDQKDGIDPGSFQANFAPVQFYSLLANDKISDENKMKYAERVETLLDSSQQFTPEKLYAKLYTSDGFVDKVARVVFYPYFTGRKVIVDLKDKGLLYKKLKELPNKENVTARTVDWDEESKKAQSEAEAKTTNNDFYVYDSYYDTYLRNGLESFKDSKSDIKLMESKEFDDYQLYLDICKDLGIEPYIIIMPTNGRWYDYTGLSKEDRDEFYDKVEEMAEEKGFEVLNLKDEEYTPYFMCDVMHLGTKGWLKVDKEIYEHFKEQ